MEAIAKKAFFVQRLNDHVQYLDKVTKTLKGRADFHGCDCHCCKLGQWLDHGGTEEIQSFVPDATSIVPELLARHAEFHEVSNQALTFHELGQDQQAYRAMTQVHTLSNRLVSLLLTIDRQARGTVAQFSVSDNS